MSPEKIKEKVLKYKWKPWLERPFGAFFMSFFKGGLIRETMEKTGVDVEYPVFLFERGMWYRSTEAEAPFIKEIKKYLAAGGSVRKISKSCEDFYGAKNKKIKQLLQKKNDILKKSREIADILALSTSYIWLAHGLEDIYAEILNKEVPKYIRGDVDKFIGDMSFPTKKNMHSKMEEALLRGDDTKAVQKKFGWIKARDGFGDGFLVGELEKLRRELLKNKPRRKETIKKIFIPKPLRELAGEVQELVYFRTLRTDVLYELLFLARPILNELAKRYGLTFKELKDYTLQDLLRGKPKKYPPNISCACYKGNLAFFDKPILLREKIFDETIKGVVAFAGKAQGTVKIVKRVEDLQKVKEGDILVAPMTFPSFIVAMKYAAAFVTDEGGITCHAAIIAREMKKPCITGTKIATKVLKDGDLVEVDAREGVIRKIGKGQGRPAEIVEKARKTTWIHWLERPYNPFIASLTFAGVGKKYYEKVGLNGFDNGFLFQNNIIYYSNEQMKKNQDMIGSFIKKKTIFHISDMLDKMHTINLDEVEKIIKSKVDPKYKLSQIREISRGYNPFLWIIKPLEEYFDKKLKTELPKYISGDVDEFIAEASLSGKKTAYEKLQDDCRSGIPAEKIQKKYAWIKSRDGFTDFYSREEIVEICKHLKGEEKWSKIKIPVVAKGLVEELRELVFFRTDRTDKFYKILAASRPVYQEVATSIGVSFEELASYDVTSILKGTPEKYGKNFSYLFLDGEEIMQEKPLLDISRLSEREIKGAAAFAGVVRGVVKIVKHSSEVGKVNIGDILVSQMTLPSFMLAMNKAAAFVTDEGGITCHAAIVAREMKKPCIIGTKIATRVLKDGDLVEVDANKGIVRKLN